MSASSTERISLRRRDGSIRAYARVDSVDHGRLAVFDWHLNDDGYVRRRVVTDDGRHRSKRLHREVLRLGDDSRHVDHINGDRLDNRRANLRVVTAAEGAQNILRSGGTSRHRGVSWYEPSGKWRATATVNRQFHHLGLFDSETAAAEVAARFRAEHMPFAVPERDAVAV